LKEARKEKKERRILASFEVEVEGRKRVANVVDIKGNVVKVEVSGKVYDVKVGGLADEEAVRIKMSPLLKKIEGKAKEVVKGITEQEEYASNVLKSPIPGRVLSIKVARGAKVKRGETLLVLESMKMQNEITSPRDGVVEQVMVKEGDKVNAGDVLVVFKEN